MTDTDAFWLGQLFSQRAVQFNEDWILFDNNWILFKQCEQRTQAFRQGAAAPEQRERRGRGVWRRPPR
jgi:hypothetical protein